MSDSNERPAVDPIMSLSDISRLATLITSVAEKVVTERLDTELSRRIAELRQELIFQRVDEEVRDAIRQAVEHSVYVLVKPQVVNAPPVEIPVKEVSECGS